MYNIYKQLTNWFAKNDHSFLLPGNAIATEQTSEQQAMEKYHSKSKPNKLPKQLF